MLNQNFLHFPPTTKKKRIIFYLFDFYEVQVFTYSVWLNIIFESDLFNYSASNTSIDFKTLMFRYFFFYRKFVIFFFIYRRGENLFFFLYLKLFLLHFKIVITSLIVVIWTFDLYFFLLFLTFFFVAKQLAFLGIRV